MNQKLKIHLSNRLDRLYENLKGQLFQKDNPFPHRMVVVYGPAMKTWLQLKMAQDPDLLISTGLDVEYINRAFPKILELCGHSVPFPSPLELELAIEVQLMNLCGSFDKLEPSLQSICSPLARYLKIKSEGQGKESKKNERRLIDLAQELAKWFKIYERFDSSLIKEWEKNPNHWQAYLWNLLYNEKTSWSCLTKAYEFPLVPPKGLEIHLFSISFLSNSEFNFINKVSKYLPVNYYLLSPCASFWSDVKSDRECLSLTNFWTKKLGESNQVEELEELLRDRNALLANFGRMGREMISLIEQSDAEIFEDYEISANVQSTHSDTYFSDNIEYKRTDGPLSILEAVQADLLFMRNPAERICIDDNDTSIQLHSAPTVQREVEILYNNLLSILQEDTSIMPHDILVMSPEIQEYVPYIQSVFGSSESVIDFQILDMGLAFLSQMTQGFLQLLSLHKSRWDSNALLQLFRIPAFRNCHQITEVDLNTIQEWISKANITWGKNRVHRNDVLKNNHCAEEMAEQSEIGTWDHGINYLLLSLTNVFENSEKIDFSQSELLGKLSILLKSLKEDLSPLYEGTLMTWSDWMSYLHCLLESYLEPCSSDTQSIKEFEQLKEQLNELSQTAKQLSEAKFSFGSIDIHLNDFFQKQGMTYREHHLQAVRFCSMVPLRSIPAKVIALLGMQEGAFPRIQVHSSLNLLDSRKNESYCPTSTDYDRYLFLELLQSVQKKLMFSYQGYNQQENQRNNPSLLIQELFSYVDKHYSIRGKAPSQLSYHHPFDAFDPSYFNETTQLRNFSQSEFKLAQNLLRKKSHQGEVEKHSNPKQKKEFSFQSIDIRQLNEMAKNPLKVYLRETIGLKLQTVEDRKIKIEENLTISHLDKHKLKQHALQSSYESIFGRAEQKGIFPLGIFKETAKIKLKDELEEIQSSLKRQELEYGDIFQVEFNPNCSSPMQLDKQNWIFPSPCIMVRAKKIQIVGKIKNVSTKGMVTIGKGSLAEYWKEWPQFLLYCIAARCEGWQLRWIFTESATSKQAFFEDPEPYLTQYVEYYLDCLDEVSPLMPDWLSSFISDGVSGIEKHYGSLENSYREDFQLFPWKWLTKNKQLENFVKPSAIKMEDIKTMLKEIKENWCKR